MEPMLTKFLPGIKQLMLKYGVERAFLFGSGAKGDMDSESDVDFIIKFPESMDFTTYADSYFQLADALEALLQRKVDLVTEKTLKNPYLVQNINRHKVQLI